MTPKERAERIATARYNKPVGNAAQDKADLVAAIEQGMNEVRSDAVKDTCSVLGQVVDHMTLKSPDNSRNTITDNQKDEKR